MEPGKAQPQFTQRFSGRYSRFLIRRVRPDVGAFLTSSGENLSSQHLCNVDNGNLNQQGGLLRVENKQLCGRGLCPRPLIPATMNPGEFAPAQTELKLAKGQSWQLPGRVIVIKHVGVHLVEFGVKRDEGLLRGVRKRIGTATQLESIEKVVRYLVEHRAVLAKQA